MAILFETRVFPDKSNAKSIAKSQLETSISNEDVTLEKLSFDAIETERFKDREDDPVGYYAYIEGSSSITDIDGTEYENHLAYYRSKFGKDYDPESNFKWVYTLTGTYEASHKEHGEIEGEFRMVYVDNGVSWCLVELEYWGSEDVLRKDVKSRIKGMLRSSYDIQTTPSVEITFIEKDRYNDYYTDYTVYGTITVKGKYGDKYSGKFTAEYNYNDHDQYFEKESIEIGDLAKVR